MTVPFPHHRRLCEDAYERLREQMAAAVALCSDEQVLDLADAMHATLRRRRAALHQAGRRAGERRAFV